MGWNQQPSPFYPPPPRKLQCYALQSHMSPWKIHHFDRKNTGIFHGDLFDRAFPCEVFLMCHLSPLECKKYHSWTSWGLVTGGFPIHRNEPCAFISGKAKKCTSNYMGVSKNNGTPKSSILIGFSIIFTIHFGIPLFLETSICWQSMHVVSWKLWNWWIRFGFIKHIPLRMHEVGELWTKKFRFSREKYIWYIYIFTTKSSGNCHWTNCYSYLFKLLQLFYMYISQTSTGKMWLGFLSKPLQMDTNSESANAAMMIRRFFLFLFFKMWNASWYEQWKKPWLVTVYRVFYRGLQ